MTPRERVLAVLRGERPDKVPFTIYECMIPQCSVERRLREEGLCIVHRRVSPVKKEAPDCRVEQVEYVEADRRRVRTVIRTPVGEISSVGEPAGFTTWTVERLFKGPEDYKVLAYWVGNQRLEADYDTWRQAESWMGEDVILRAGVGAAPLHTIMIHWMGVETFAVEWLERRDEVLALEAAAGAGVPAAGGRSDYPRQHVRQRGARGDGPGPLPPPRPAPHKLLRGGLHRRGQAAGVAHGRQQPRLGGGLHYVEAFTPAPDTDMTLAEALEAWPDKVLWINFPSSLHLAGVDRIKAATREFVELARQTNRVIIGITEDIPADRWQESLSAISEVINK